MYHIIAFQHKVSFLEGFKHTIFLFKDAILVFFVTLLFPHIYVAMILPAIYPWSIPTV